jgi:hypothetical protein
MTIVGSVLTDAGRINPWALADDLAADGFDVRVVELLVAAPGSRERFRIVATYPAEWLLSGWKKGCA